MVSALTCSASPDGRLSLAVLVASCISHAPRFWATTRTLHVWGIAWLLVVAAVAAWEVVLGRWVETGKKGQPRLIFGWIRYRMPSKGVGNNLKCAQESLDDLESLRLSLRIPNNFLSKAWARVGQQTPLRLGSSVPQPLLGVQPSVGAYLAPADLPVSPSNDFIKGA